MVELYKLNDFIFDKEENVLNAEIEINVKHAIFEGHFPDKPILPGVCQIEILGELVNKLYDGDYRMLKAKTVKFLSVVDPNINLKLNYKLKMIDKGKVKSIAASAAFLDGEVCFKLNGDFVKS